MGKVTEGSGLIEEAKTGNPSDPGHSPGFGMAERRLEEQQP